MSELEELRLDVYREKNLLESLRGQRAAKEESLCAQNGTQEESLQAQKAAKEERLRAQRASREASMVAPLCGPLLHPPQCHSQPQEAGGGGSAEEAARR